MTAATDGTLLRGEVAVRWREFAGTGELLRSLEGRVGRIRDRLVNAVKGSGQQAERVAVAIESAVELMVLDHAEGAADGDRRGLGGARHRRAASWRSPTTTSAGPRGDLRRRVEGEVRAWQQQLTDLVKADDVERHTSRYLAYGARGLAVDAGGDGARRHGADRRPTSGAERWAAPCSTPSSAPSVRRPDRPRPGRPGAPGRRACSAAERTRALGCSTPSASTTTPAGRCARRPAGSTTDASSRAAPATNRQP